MAPCKRNGCAFFGSDATDGYCSKCHKARVQTSTTSPKATSSSDQSPAVGETIALTVDDPQRHTTVEPKGELNSSRQQSEGSSVRGEKDTDDTAVMVEMAEGHRNSQQGDGAVRCCSCNKRLRLADKFLCRCGEVFCSVHRHYKDHSCTFDYKASGRAAIAKANPIVTGSKLKKI